MILTKIRSKDSNFDDKWMHDIANVTLLAPPAPGKSTVLPTQYSLPTLYSISSKGKPKQWNIRVLLIADFVYVETSHGYVGMKQAVERSSAIEGKNLGRKNATTPLDQAISEAESKWKKKIDQNYSETQPTSIEEFKSLRPMLAQKYSDRSSYISFPAAVQPKYDGVRCLATTVSDSIQFSSRGDKAYTTLGHIEEALKKLPEKFRTAPLDGEVFRPGWSLQQINQRVKKWGEDTKELKFYIFDIANPELDFEDRLRIMIEIHGEIQRLSLSEVVEVTPTYPVRNDAEIQARHKQFSVEHEGTMIRNLKGKYTFDYRSNDLQKHKDFLDAEFKIVGGKEGSGPDEGTIVFRCVTEDGKEFDVRPRGTRDKRKEWYDNLADIIGKMLTVRYQQLSDDGIPIFPVGIAIRDYE